MPNLHDDIERHGVAVIAEIGCNHGGDKAAAIRLVEAAAFCGATAVKSQKRCMCDECMERPERRDWHKPHPNPVHSFGEPYRAHREALELTAPQHLDVAIEAEERGMAYGMSCWDLHSVEECADWADFFKAPSALLTDEPLVRAMAATGKPLILSSGMSTQREVDDAVQWASEEGAAALYVLQCTSTYPMDPADANLRVIEHWARERLPRDWLLVDGVGLSNHHAGLPLDAAAVALGGTVIERHFTLDRNAKGTDHSASLSVDGLRRTVRDCRAVASAMGDGVKRVLPSELPALKKLRGVS